MKKIILVLFLIFISTGCVSQQNPSRDMKNEIKPEKNEEGEWEILVFDAQYESFLNSRATPRSMYSESALKNRNTVLVTEWNSYFYSGRYRNVVESTIDYDPNENYGFEFEYRLYQVFAYANWKYGLKLTNLSGMDSKK